MEPFRLYWLILPLTAVLPGHSASPLAPAWQVRADASQVKVYRVQIESNPDPTGGYDWGACVMKDGDLYRMWWTRPGARTDQTNTFDATAADGKPVALRYSLRGDRIYYAESRDGYRWNLNGDGEGQSIESYTPDSSGPVVVLRPSETQWERRHLGCVSVVKVEETFYLYYEAPCAFEVRTNAAGQLEAGQEYHNQVFAATSRDGRHFSKWPLNEAPQPILSAPTGNFQPGRRRYGLGQPSVCYRDGRFILHYVDACTWYPDVIVRLEASDPFFRDAKPATHGLAKPDHKGTPPPDGAVAKFAQTDLCWLGNSFYLVRPVYGTDRIALLRSNSGVFACDDASNDPLAAPRQIPLHDPRNVKYRARMYPRFLRSPHGEIIGDGTRFTVFYGSGDWDAGPGWPPSTWDIFRADIVFSEPLAESL